MRIPRSVCLRFGSSPINNSTYCELCQAIIYTQDRIDYLSMGLVIILRESDNTLPSCSVVWAFCRYVPAARNGKDSIVPS